MEDTTGLRLRPRRGASTKAQPETRTGGAASAAGDTRITRVAVVAHRKKTLGGGLAELRRTILDQGVEDLRWYEVSKSRKAPKAARRAHREGAELIFVWGGDGMVQHCVDALAGAGATIAIVPAGTANLLAADLGIPTDLAAAVDIGLYGDQRTLDLGHVNGEHFAVMAGAGFDGELMGDADRSLKEAAGRFAYVLAGLRRVRDEPTPTTIKVDGVTWFDGTASCVLLGNIGTITGGLRVFADADPCDGWLDVGVGTADGVLDWARTFGRIVAGQAERSPFVRVTRARKVTVRFGAPVRYELDGGARKRVTRLKAGVVPRAVTVRVPVEADA